MARSRSIAPPIRPIPAKSDTSDRPFVPPVAIRLDHVTDLKREIFGPVLHVATFKASQIDAVVKAVNATGYGLTFGLHTRIDDRVQAVVDALAGGNTYVNRNQIGAVVGSQPFGGEGLSGTGPKAGGPHYVARMSARPAPQAGSAVAWDAQADPAVLAARISAAQPTATLVEEALLPGPTGELNRLTARARPPLLCMGPGEAAMRAQMAMVKALGGVSVGVEGALAPAQLRSPARKKQSDCSQSTG